MTNLPARLCTKSRTFLPECVLWGEILHYHVDVLMLAAVPWISCKLGMDLTRSSMRPLIIQCFHVLIVLIAHQVGRCISMLFLESFFAQFFSLGQFTPCQACLLGSFWRRRKVQPWKKYTRAPCKIACTGKVYHENEHPQEKCTMKT